MHATIKSQAISSTYLPRAEEENNCTMYINYATNADSHHELKQLNSLSLSRANRFANIHISHFFTTSAAAAAWHGVRQS